MKGIIQASKRFALNRGWKFNLTKEAYFNMQSQSSLSFHIRALYSWIFHYFHIHPVICNNAFFFFCVIVVCSTFNISWSTHSIKGWHDKKERLVSLQSSFPAHHPGLKRNCSFLMIPNTIWNQIWEFWTVVCGSTELRTKNLATRGYGLPLETCYQISTRIAVDWEWYLNHSA